MEERMKQLPNLFTRLNGQEVSTSDDWLQGCRDEIVELFRQHVYGRTPVQRPKHAKIHIETTSEALDGLATRKEVSMTYEGPGGQGRMPVIMYVPNGIDKPVPAFVLICSRQIEVTDPDFPDIDNFWPVEYILKRGYATIVLQTKYVDPDEHDGFQNGVHGLFDAPDVPRSADAWGTISAWAWGASRVMDIIEEEADIDASKVALVGHSRGGKTALWAAAQDERYAMVVSNNSGCTGAAISRGKKGESIEQINTVFPHWFNENYKQYNKREDDLPVDQHMLLSLIAPRPLYVASASEDEWADPESEYISLIAAAPVYHLLGQEALTEQQLPPVNTPINQGKVGYHLREGAHKLTKYDWRCFLDFADEKL